MLSKFIGSELIWCRLSTDLQLFMCCRASSGSSSIAHLVRRTLVQPFDRRIESTLASVDRRLAGQTGWKSVESSPLICR